MIDRLVCADGGNPDPSSTHGKKPAEAKEIENSGWSYPQHMAGRVYGLMVHGDVAGIGLVVLAVNFWMLQRLAVFRWTRVPCSTRSALTSDRSTLSSARSEFGT